MKSAKPWEQPKKKKRKKSARPRPEALARRYTLPAWAMEEIKKAAPEYQSHGRVLQVAMEILTRMETPPPPDPQPGDMAQMTYRIPPRTVDLIEELAKSQYNNDRPQVFAAGMKALKMKKIK
jgi:hypothetical protein